VGRGLKSNAQQFAMAGDVWFCERFAGQEYPLTTDDNPDHDRWTRASFAKAARSKHKLSLWAPHKRKAVVVGESRDTSWNARIARTQRLNKLVAWAEYSKK
jgi:hypothetical protein